MVARQRSARRRSYSPLKKNQLPEPVAYGCPHKRNRPPGKARNRKPPISRPSAHGPFLIIGWLISLRSRSIVSEFRDSNFGNKHRPDLTGCSRPRRLQVSSAGPTTRGRRPGPANLEMSFELRPPRPPPRHRASLEFLRWVRKYPEWHECTYIARNECLQDAIPWFLGPRATPDAVDGHSRGNKSAARRVVILLGCPAATDWTNAGGPLLLRRPRTHSRTFESFYNEPARDTVPSRGEAQKLKVDCRVSVTLWLWLAPLRLDSIECRPSAADRP